MAKFVGIIGLLQTAEKEPGNFVPAPREIKVKGDLLKNIIRRDSIQTSTNDNIVVSNQISIVADPYTKEHVFEMAYLKFKLPKLGGVWKIKNAEIKEPRILLTLGGVYSGITVDTSQHADESIG